MYKRDSFLGRTSLKRIWALCASLVLIVLAACVDLRAQATKEEATGALQRGLYVAENEAPDKAVAELRNATHHFKRNSTAWYLLGIAQARNGEFAHADDSFKQALKLNPSYIMAHVGRARSLLLLNNVKAAEKEGRHLVNVQQADTHYVFGLVQLLSGDADKSLAEAEASIQSNPTFASSYFLKYQAILLQLVFGGAISKTDPVKRQQILTDALHSLAQYVELSPERKTDPFLMEQERSLRGHLDAAEKKSVFRTSELTTKARVQSKPNPRYPEAARENFMTGTVVLWAIFTAEGKVSDILAIKSLPLGLTEQCIEAASGIKITPAIKDGKPVSMYAQLEYSFSID
ncbi:MAG: hypothetical protein QOE77_1377 [Blastocatellia bacterium]|nr:hypothetical protein [Blastocatellia bacterium]